MKSAMRSYAALSRSRPPMTDCSASIECGGIRRESSCGSEGAFMARIIPASASGQKKRAKNQRKIHHEYTKNRQQKSRASPAFQIAASLAGPARRRLRVRVSDDSDNNFYNNVGVQSNRNVVLANNFQRAGRHTDLCFFNSKTLLGQRFSDVEVGDGTEQTAINTSFLSNLNGQAVQFFALGLRCSQFGGSSFFQFSALDFEFSHSGSRSTTCQALWDQEVTCITVFNFDDFAEVTDVNNFF